MIQRLIFICIFSTCIFFSSFAQNQGGVLTGRLEANGNFFIRDSAIGAANTPQYDRQLFGSDVWLNLNYSNWGFDFGLRLDQFNNSNLLNPTGSFNGQGIGFWFIKKKIDKLTITGGNFYDQFGSGLIFRAYEQRPLLIDNSVFGLRIAYELAPEWELKAFVGKQKRQFDIYDSVLKGANVEGYLSLGKEGKIGLAPGFGVTNRTLDDNSMNSLVATINTYNKEEAFVPKYNTYAASLYNNLTSGPWSWYVEAAYKTEDNMNDLDPETPRFFLSDGTVFYSSLSFAKKGFGLLVEGKRTENFTYRTRPDESLNRGLVNFLPPMNRVNTYRLTARYAPATQELGELAYQIDARYAPSKTLAFNANFSRITDLESNLLFQEIYTEVTLKKRRKWTLLAGVQSVNYNQEVYEVKPNVGILESVTPYFDYLYKIDKKKAIRFEGQYMFTGLGLYGFDNRDFGDWLFGLVEFTIAPHWTFSVSDMYNIDPKKTEKAEHYPRFDIYYAYKSSRFSLSYVKQVEGIVCAGGVCRLEPAFSGVKLTLNSSF